MGVFTFTEQDIARTKLVTPGRYLSEITDYKEMTSADGSRTEAVTFTGLEGEAKHVPCTMFYNEKDEARFFAIPLFTALNNGEPLQPGVEYKLSPGIVGIKLYGFWSQRINKQSGQKQNQIADFAPAPQAA